MNLRQIIILLSVVCCTNISYSQAPETLNWHFGQNAWLNFSSGVPVPVTGSAINGPEGVASISDNTGQSIIYTDGITVYNRNNTIMPNGNGLLGHWSSTQSGVIVNYPGISGRYIIFSNNTYLNPGSIHYSVVDMSLDNGLGDIIPSQKNISLLSGVVEKVEVIRHCNGEDYWLIAASTTNIFVAPLTSSGVGSFSSFPIPSQTRTHGYMKANSLGTQIALANWGVNIELFDFDNASGIISNRRVLSGQRNQYYGLSFSPNDRLLYVNHMGRDGQCEVYQFNLMAGTTPQIQSSRITVASIISNASNNYPEFSALQLGPDGKLYLAVSSWPPSPNHHPRGPLSVFNSPNSMGIASGFNFDAIALGSGVSRSGLPNIPAFFLTSYSVRDTICQGSTYLFGSQTLNTAGIYTEKFLSSRGCDSTVILNLAVSNVLQLGNISTTNPTCTGDDGSITIAASGGTLPYTFSIDNGTTFQSSNSFSSLSAGIYNVVVRDAANCQNNNNGQVVLNSTSPVALSIVNVDSTECGISNGSATVAAAGGAMPYNYLWSNGETVATAIGLSEGLTGVTVTDANLCVNSLDIFIPIKNPLSVSIISITPSSCDIPDGSATIDIIGGVSPYTIDWSNGDTVYTAANLFEGAYTVTVTDVNGCSDTTDVIVLNAIILSVSFEISQYSGTHNVSCAGNNDGEIILTVDGGNEPYSYSWSNSDTTKDLNNVYAGIYEVTITDASDCSTTTTFSVTEPTALLSAVSIINNNCNDNDDGSVYIEITGGTLPYLIEWSNGDTSDTISNLTSGVYSATVRDANNCITTSEGIIESKNLSLSIVSDTIMFEFDSLQLFAEAIGVINNGNYYWSPEEHLTCSDCQNPTAYPSATTQYIVTYTDITGCAVTDTINIEVIQGNYHFYMPNAFSPNNDGQNDILFPIMAGVKQFTWRIHDRWGEMIYECSNSSMPCSWDGTFKGKELIPSVFVWEAVVEYKKPTIMKYKGSVVLIR